MKLRSNYILVFIIGIMTLTLHIPFLLSDPDRNIAESRDANTDEGLNTCQIRNYINHNDLTFKKSDNFVKTPLFGCILFIPFKIFGTNQIVGRLTVLFLSLAICLYIYSFNKYYARLGLISLIIVFCEYYVFHYFHFCLVEMLSTVLIFLSIFILVESYKSSFNLSSSFLSATTISVAYYLKIQFFYVIIILPLSIMVFMLLKSSNKKQLVKQLLFTTLFLTIYLIIYFLVWYLPNKDFYNYVMAEQTANRFVSFSNLSNYLSFILNHIFYNKFLKYFTICFYILFFIGLVNIFITKSIRFKFLFIGITCWIFVELHKLTMTYLPTRYLISLFFPMGIIITLVLLELISLQGKSRINYAIKALSILLILYFCLQNSIDYVSSYKNRTYNILAVNRYLSNYNFANKPIIGAWAPSLSWNSKAITFPIWKDYFNDKEVMNKYKPSIIIAELDEEDSNQAFSSRGIELDSYADSIKYFTINRWDIKLLWINQSTYNILDSQ